MKECVIERQILDYLNSLPNSFSWKPFDSISTHRVAYQIAGQSDIVAVINGRVLFIEVKNETGRQSDAQKAFQKRLEQAGGHYHLVRNLEQLKTAIAEVL